MTMLRIKLEYLKKQRKFYTDKAQVWTFAAVAFFLKIFIWIFHLVNSNGDNVVAKYPKHDLHECTFC